MYQNCLSKEDEKWLKALKWEGVTSEEEHIEEKINMLQL
jgi:hypothetical protein